MNLSQIYENIHNITIKSADFRFCKRINCMFTTVISVARFIKQMKIIKKNRKALRSAFLPFVIVNSN